MGKETAYVKEISYGDFSLESPSACEILNKLNLGAILPFIFVEIFLTALLKSTLSPGSSDVWDLHTSVCEICTESN